MKTRRFVMMAVLVGMAASMFAQEVSESKYGADSVACVTNISIYREYFKQWEAAKYSDESFSPEMISAWRKVFLNCPRASELTYTNGQKIMDYFIGKAKTKELRNTYIDTLCMIHDGRAQYFPTKKNGTSQVAAIMARKGHDVYAYNKDRYEEAYNILKEAVAMDVNQLQVAYLDTYFRTVVDMANAKKMEKMGVIEVYQDLSDVIDRDMKGAVEAADERMIANYKGVKNNLDNSFQPFASCEDLVAVFTAKMAENPNDINVLKKITTILDRKDCTNAKVFLDASMKLHELEPSPESAYNIGVKLFGEKNYRQAAEYFEQSTSSENSERVYRAYRNLAYCYMNMSNYSKSRDAARRAAAVDPTAGEPYIIIGLDYAASAQQIGEGDFYGRVAYWAAVDKFNKAKQLDSTVADRASDYIRSYSQHFPTMENIFFNDFNVGDSYTVGGWINETTTIRASK